MLNIWMQLFFIDWKREVYNKKRKNSEKINDCIVYVNENVLPVCDMTGLNDNKKKVK